MGKKDKNHDPPSSECRYDVRFKIFKRNGIRNDITVHDHESRNPCKEVFVVFPIFFLFKAYPGYAFFHQDKTGRKKRVSENNEKNTKLKSH